MGSIEQHMERINYELDARNCQRAEAPVLYLDDGSELALPLIWVICPVCRGEGKHVNPAIDCGGLSREDFDEDPDFAEDYFSGAYDQECNRCGGRSSIQEVNWDALSDEQRVAYRAQLADEAAGWAEHMAEVRAGA